MRKIFQIALSTLGVFSFFLIQHCSQVHPGNDNPDMDGVTLLAVATLLRDSGALAIAGEWNDTSDVDANYSISDVTYTRLAYLGSTSPKRDYVQDIVSYDNNEKVVKLKGLQLDFSGWPAVETLSNTVYQRIRFAVADAGTFYYCTESYNKASLAELDADPTAYFFTGPSDATCGGFTWSKMVRR